MFILFYKKQNVLKCERMNIVHILSMTDLVVQEKLSIYTRMSGSPKNLFALEKSRLRWSKFRLYL